MATRWLLATTLLLAGSMSVHAAEPPTVAIAADGKPAPAWATNELKWLDAMQKCYHLWLDRLVEGKMDLPVCKQLTEDGGCDDDWAEGVAPWDRYVLHRHDPRVQLRYVQFWNAIFRERRMPGTNGFWNTGGFDPEHTSELFQLLWGAIELSPTNPKLIADNRRVMDFVLDTFYDPKLHLFTNTHAFKPRKDQDLGDVIENCMWLTGAFHAYLTTGEAKYRSFALDYGTSWNELAAANGGMFPYYVPPASRKPAEVWWKSPHKGSFGYEQWGITVGVRTANSLPTILCLLDHGNLKHVSGLASTVDYLFAHGRDGLPAAMADGKGSMVRGDKGNWSVPRLIDHVYALTFDPKVLGRIRSYVHAANKPGPDGKAAAPDEAGHLTFHEFTYLGTKDLDWLADLYGNQAERRLKDMDRLKSGEGLKVGDDGRDKYHVSRWGFEFLDGCFWGTWDSARCGPPVLSSVRYFTADGQPGMPLDIAAVVRHVAKDHVVVLLHNRATTETALLMTAGFYGQHRFTSVKVNDGEAQPIGDRRVKLVLAPGATAQLDFAIERFANPPTLQPQAPAS